LQLRELKLGLVVTKAIEYLYKPVQHLDGIFGFVFD
jgi:hypothetical protein